ncbi:hypothetical protein IWQ62_004388 [Dispira parvispora]|uniref:Extracellular membrane protein CFEM domain-containing protein n=1 Tax=Dispira parvispora TaxID=1520584 RepID=A0A9W8ASZ8_9FUNG|nr:hypothetical protein IWQ62_004388 [Dispira parvispora]
MKATLTSLSSIGLFLAAFCATPIQADCLAEDAIDMCVIKASANLSVCSLTDYTCRCNAQKEISGCYVNCFDEDDQFEAEALANAFCSRATAEASSTALEPTSSATESDSNASSPTTTRTKDEETTRTGATSRATSTSNVNGLDVVDNLNGSQNVAPSSVVALTGAVVLAAYVMM